MVIETVINQMMNENKARTKNEIQGEIFCCAALYPTDTEGKQDLLPSMRPLMSYKATSDTDYMPISSQLSHCYATRSYRSS